MIPKKAKWASAHFTVYASFEIPEDIDRDEVKQTWVKWGTLWIEMKDGTKHEVGYDLTDEDIEWKYPSSEQLYDEDWNEVYEDE